MKLSVNILTWNCFRTLFDTLGVLKKELEGLEAEIIVVDNGSSDDTQHLMNLESVIKDWPRIRYIRNDKNLGISVGKNQGIDASKGQYIMLIDADIIPVPNSIRCLMQHLEDNPECEAIGFLPDKFSNQKNRNGQHNHEEFCEKLDPIIEHKGHCVYYGMYRREVWFDKGVRFDEALGPGYGYEDLDTYMQMDSKGIKQWAAGINHRCGKYYHEINSSIRIMGFEKYMETQRKRGDYFKKKWMCANVV